MAEGHRYVYSYGYNPGAAAAGVIGGTLGAAAGYPYYCDSYYYGPYMAPAPGTTGVAITGRITVDSATGTAQATTAMAIMAIASATAKVLAAGSPAAAT